MALHSADTAQIQEGFIPNITKVF